MRLIDANKLREDMLLALCGTGYQSVGLREIDFAPTVEAKPVIHGHWITYDKEYDKCSICGNLHHYSESYGYYCQHCGGKMDG